MGTGSSPQFAICIGPARHGDVPVPFFAVRRRGPSNKGDRHRALTVSPALSLHLARSQSPLLDCIVFSLS